MGPNSGVHATDGRDRRGGECGGVKEMGYYVGGKESQLLVRLEEGTPKALQGFL